MSLSDEIQRSLGRIEGTQEGMLDELRRIGTYVENVSGRVGRLETRVAGMLGYAAGAGAVAGMVVALLARALF